MIGRGESPTRGAFASATSAPVGCRRLPAARRGRVNGRFLREFLSLVGAAASRDPMFWFRSSGSVLLRFADRQFLPSLFQLPPRRTRADARAFTRKLIQHSAAKSPTFDPCGTSEGDHGLPSSLDLLFAHLAPGHRPFDRSEVPPVPSSAAGAQHEVCWQDPAAEEIQTVPRPVDVRPGFDGQPQPHVKERADVDQGAPECI